MVSVGFGCDLSLLPHSPPVPQTVPGFANLEEIIATENFWVQTSQRSIIIPPRFQELPHFMGI